MCTLVPYVCDLMMCNDVDKAFEKQNGSCKEQDKTNRG